MIKEKQEMEFPDAPSGFVTLYNYKEPFMPFKYEDEGYGYEGVLLFDGSSDKVQCHFCGDWYEALGGHLHKEHNMKASEYKEIVGLRQSTALIGEKLRAKMISNGQSRFGNIRKSPGHTEETKKKISETLKKMTRQKQNEEGTCPFQLIDRLKKRAQELGRCPTSDEITFVEVLRKTYGTFSQACVIAGLQPRLPGQTVNNPHTISEEQIVTFVKNFWIANHSFPRFKDFTSETMWYKYKKIKNEINKQVLFGERVYQKTSVRISYTKPELIQILSIFKEENGRLPSISDCNRGLLPHASRFFYHFGTFKKALQNV